MIAFPKFWCGLKYVLNFVQCLILLFFFPKIYFVFNTTSVFLMAYLINNN